MITEFNKYNLIIESSYAYNNDDVLLCAKENHVDPPETLIGDGVKYINDLVNILGEYNDEVYNGQINYVNDHKSESMIITGKFYGNQWWSKFSEGNPTSDNSWIPDKYLILYKPTPMYMLSKEDRDKRFIRECIYFDNNKSTLDYVYRKKVQSSKFLIGDSIEFVSPLVFDPNDNLNDNQKKFLHQHSKEILTVNRKFYGNQWWSKFNEDDFCWIPDKYFIKYIPKPNYMLSKEDRDKRFIRENKKEDREKRLKKDETKYLSKKERETLTEPQRRVLVARRKEKGSWNDEDWQTESLRDKMVGKSKDEVNNIVGNDKDSYKKYYMNNVWKIVKTELEEKFEDIKFHKEETVYTVRYYITDSHDDEENLYKIKDIINNYSIICINSNFNGHSALKITIEKHTIPQW